MRTAKTLIRLGAHAILLVCHEAAQIMNIRNYWSLTYFSWIRYQHNRIPNEPCYEIIVRFVLRKFILQTHMRSRPLGLNVWFLVGPFVHFYTLCVRTAKALADCTDAQARLSLRWSSISNIISWAGSNGLTSMLCIFMTTPFVQLSSWYSDVLYDKSKI